MITIHTDAGVYLCWPYILFGRHSQGTYRTVAIPCQFDQRGSAHTIKVPWEDPKSTTFPFYSINSDQLEIQYLLSVVATSIVVE